MDRAKYDSLPRVIKLFLLIGNRLLRDTLLRLCKKPTDISVAGYGAPSLVTSSEITASQCDIVLTDSFEPNVPSFDPLFNDFAKTFSAELLLVGMNDNENEFLSAVRAGASGYLLKDASAGDVVAAIRALFRGEAVCPPNLCLSVFKWVSEEFRSRTKRPDEPRPTLTLRQQQLVSLVAKGLTNKEIAAHLNLSEFTIKNHIHRIMRQVDAENRQQVVETLRAQGYLVN